MNAPAHLLEWTEGNQRLLVAEFARIKCLLRGEDLGEARVEIDFRRSAMPAPAAIDTIAERFGLSGFERDILLLTAGVEMDAELAEMCAVASPARRPDASFGLALALLPNAHWSALTSGRPLRRWRLIEPIDDSLLAASRLAIDERVLHYLAGLNALDVRLEPLVRCIAPEIPIAPAHVRVGDAIVAALERWNGDEPPVVQLLGADVHGKRDVAAVVASHYGWQLLALPADAVPQTARERNSLARLVEREAALLGTVLLLEDIDAMHSAAVADLVRRIAGLVFVATNEAVAIEREDLRERVDMPGRDEQRALWQAVLGPRTPSLVAAVDDLASDAILSAAQIRRIGRRMQTEPAGRCGETALRAACRALRLRQLHGLAQCIEPCASWDDLVLPESQLEMLRHIVVHLRHRLTVLERWGFGARGARGLGLAALFVGESGTGKTMAAEVLSHTLGLELYRIDLAALVSKYIGETEKNLARVFDAAEDGGAILLFDEADALFGKRSEVRDSHDRYANIEVSYLLQRMEAYRGLAILTTNQKAALDPAFMRRLRFVVHFPFPDLAQREALWRRVFPSTAPTQGLDPTKLARLHASGAGIRNVALHAAFLAAEAGEQVGMKHILCAARADAAKRERALTDGEIRGWV